LDPRSPALGYSGQGQLRIFGPSNEKYHVRGGNDQIPARLIEALKGQIKLGSELIAIRLNSDGSYRLTLQSGSGASTATADHVVLALPFSLLRSVDYSKAGFSAVKNKAIQQLAWAPTRSSTSSSPGGSGMTSAIRATPTPTPATRTPGR
jgi:monoamine oxidase